MHLAGCLRLSQGLEDTSDAGAFAEPKLTRYVVSSDEPRRIEYTRPFDRTHEKAVHIAYVLQPGGRCFGSVRAGEAAGGGGIGEGEKDDGVSGIAEIAVEAVEGAARRRGADGGKLDGAEVFGDEGGDEADLGRGESEAAQDAGGGLSTGVSVAVEVGIAIGRERAGLRLGDIVEEAGDLEEEARVRPSVVGAARYARRSGSRQAKTSQRVDQSPASGRSGWDGASMMSSASTVWRLWSNTS